MFHVEHDTFILNVSRGTFLCNDDVLCVLFAEQVSRETFAFLPTRFFNIMIIFEFCANNLIETIAFILFSWYNIRRIFFGGI